MSRTALLFSAVLVAIAPANVEAAPLLFEAQAFYDVIDGTLPEPPSLVAQVRVSENGIPAATWTIPRFTAADEGNSWTLNRASAPSFGADWQGFVDWGRSWPGTSGGLQTIAYGFGDSSLHRRHRITASGTGGVWDIGAIAFTLDQFRQTRVPERDAEVAGEAMFVEALATFRVFGVPEPSSALLAVVLCCFVAHRVRFRCR